MPWVTWIATDDENSSNPEVRGLYESARNPRTGAVPDLVRLTSRTPEVARLLHRLSTAVYKNAKGLTPREKEIIALISSSYIGCVH